MGNKTVKSQHTASSTEDLPRRRSRPPSSADERRRTKIDDVEPPKRRFERTSVRIQVNDARLRASFGERHRSSARRKLMNMLNAKVSVSPTDRSTDNLADVSNDDSHQGRFVSQLHRTTAFHPRNTSGGGGGGGFGVGGAKTAATAGGNTSGGSSGTGRRAQLAEPEPSISDSSSECGQRSAVASLTSTSNYLDAAAAAAAAGATVAATLDATFERVGDSSQTCVQRPMCNGEQTRTTLRQPATATATTATSHNHTSSAKTHQKPTRLGTGARPKLSFFSHVGGDIRRRLRLPRTSVASAEDIGDAASIAGSNAAAFSTEMEPMKSAFYNVSVFTMAVCCVFGMLAAYYLFYEFVKPAMWALICGIVLYPLKRQLTTLVKNWLGHLSETGTPLTLAIFSLPWDVTNQWGEFLLDSMTTNFKTVALMLAAFPASALLLHFETIPWLLVTTKQSLVFVDSLVVFFNARWVPVLLTVYLLFVCLSKVLGNYRNAFLHSCLVSWSIWLASVAYACNYVGPFRTPLFALILALCSTYYMPLINSFLSTKRQLLRGNRKPSKRRSIKGRNRSGSQRRRPIAADQDQIDDQSPRKSAEIQSNVDGEFESNQTAVAAESGSASESNIYLKRLLIACFFVYVSLHLWMVTLVILPLGVAIIHRVAIMFDICTHIDRYWKKFRAALGSDAHLLIPPPLHHLLSVLMRIDGQIIYCLRQSMDMVGSLTAMIVLLFGVALLGGFVTFQLYYESMHLINLTADIANQTLTKNPGLQKWLRQTVQVESVTELADQAVHRAYAYGRGWMSEKVHEIVENDTEKALLLESQILNTFDTIFHGWLARNQSAEVSAQHKTAIAQWADVWTSIGETGGDLDWNFFDNLNEYMAVLWSLTDSAWLILKNNVEVLMIGLSQILSILLASGTAVVDFFLDSIVFLSFLLYLLSESDDEYKPLKMIREMVPGGRATASKITEQVEQAVNGVFLATAKMAIFYGMFTWLTHTLFAVNLVFIPSVLAALFAAIPFFGTYLVALPAVMELWLIRGEPFLAVLLFVLHYIPSYVVDDAIYSDISLTTPLLSGMAIAGGILWWGLEGAVLGPLVLCCILVLGGVYKAIFFKTMSSNVSSSISGSSREGSVVAVDDAPSTVDLQQSQNLNGNLKH